MRDACGGPVSTSGACLADLHVCHFYARLTASPPRRWCIPVLMLASFQKCVSVSGPGFLDEKDEDKEEQKAKKKQKIEEDEIAELRKRNWDEPFMTYEPHPSAVGWDKAHWKALDWVSWVITGAVLLLIRVGPSNVLGACAAHCGVSHASMSTTPWSLLRSCCGALCAAHVPALMWAWPAGPVLSLLFTVFVTATFGWLPGLAASLACLGVDAATYYWNW